ncbi:MAG: RES family NAD+ phosphorylase [Mycobacterium sp.]
MGATEFNTTWASRRFRPIQNSRRAIVPTIYGADLVEGALSETIFHDVPIRGPGRRILRKALVPMVMSTIIPVRDLRLAELHGAGLRRLGITHGELIETGASEYPRTAFWGQALYEHTDRFDGLIWRSRQFNDSLALMLWGDRVTRFTDINPHPGSAPVPLFAGDGFEKVRELAEAVAITIVE